MTGRPEPLFPLFAGLETIEGVGPKTAQHFAQLNIIAPGDLLFTLPYSGIDRQLRPSIKDAILPDTVTVAITVGPHRPAANKTGAYRIHVEDSQTSFQLVFFHARGDYLKRQLPEGSRRIVSGRVELFDGMAQMVHPDFMVAEDEADQVPTFEPVYPLTSGITQKLMYKATRASLTRVPEFDEWIDPSQKAKASWPDFNVAIHAAHDPETMADLSATAPARERLAYDEFMAHQLTLALARAKERRKKGRPSMGTGELQKRVLAALPYKPTTAQTRAISEIAADMASAQRMNRLLQGDVGAGKTLVAFMALLAAVESGGQGVLMAPTEILARQHLEGLQPLAEQAGVVLEILTGRD
ncbi:MAG: DEAD/DEAH box helicase, partial [Yoonia sp.]